MRTQYVVSHLIFVNAGMQRQVATCFSTVVSCSDLNGFSSDEYLPGFPSYLVQTLLAVSSVK